ncbi:MAG: hypothetical protein ACLPLP_13130 [Mycobacterium sp.]
MKTIEFVFAFAFLWVLTTVITGEAWLWPLVFTALCAYVFYDDQRKKRTQIRKAEKDAEKLGEVAAMMTAADRRRLADANAAQIVAAVRRRAAEIQAIAEAKRGFGSLLNDEAIVMLCNPN